MPIFLINILISLAIKFGLAFFFKRFPGIPEEIKQIIKDLLESLKLAKTKAERAQLKAEAKQKVKKVCEGIACPADLKG